MDGAGKLLLLLVEERVIPPFDHRRREIAANAHNRRTASLVERANQYPAHPVLTALDEAVAELGRSIGSDRTGWGSATEDVRVARVVEARGDLERRARQAYRRREHRDHPIVQEFMAGRRTFGDRPQLRALKNVNAGLTRGVQKPLKIADEWLIGTLTDAPCKRKPVHLIHYANHKLKQVDWLPEYMADLNEPQRRKLRADLTRRLGVSRQAIEKWLTRLGLHVPGVRRRKSAT